MQVTKGDNVYKFLGLVITNSLSWKDHLTQLTPRVCKACYVLRCIRPFMSQNTLKSVPWQASSPDTWTGFEITYFLLNLFIPPFKPSCLSPSRVPYHPLWSYLLNHPLAKQLSWSVLCSQNQSSHTRLLYMFKVLKYRVCNKYVRLFSSEQEFWCSPRYLRTKRLCCVYSRLVY